MAEKVASVSVSRGKKVSEWHDRRAHLPENAEATFADGNAILFDVGPFKDAVNKEMRSTIAAYNDRRAAAGAEKKAEIEAFNADAERRNEEHAGDAGWAPIKLRRFRAEKYAGKSYDYYSEVENTAYSNDQQPVLEFVIQFGRRETHGVCDDPFDDEEYEECQRLDAEDGGARAEEYERTHFDYDAWADMKERDPEAASAYAQAHRASGDKKTRHDEACRMALELGQRIVANPGRYLPKGAKLMMVVLHDDEPGGTPHLHVAFTPFAEGYKNGLEKRISLSKCFHDAGYTGNEYMKTWQDEIKSRMLDVMCDHGYEREFMNNSRAHLAPNEMREKSRAERARRHAERIEAELYEKLDELARVENDLDGARCELDKTRLSSAAAISEIGSARRELARAESTSKRAAALAEIREHGYTPPEHRGVHLLRQDVDYTYTDELYAIDQWFSLAAEADGLDDLDVPEPTLRAMREGDENALLKRYEAALGEQLTKRFGPGELLDLSPVKFWIDVDEDDDFLSLDEQLNLEARLWGEIAPAVEAGIDPAESYLGVEERERVVDERERDVERRERAVSAREQKAGRDEDANELRAADLTAAARELARVEDRLDFVQQVEGRDADQFADDVVLTFASELAESGIPAYVTCADTMRKQWLHGRRQRVVNGAGYVSERPLREIVLETVRRGGGLMRRLKDGLKATIDRALDAIGQHETAGQKARRTKAAPARAAPANRYDLEKRASGPSTRPQRFHEDDGMAL